MLMPGKILMVKLKANNTAIKSHEREREAQAWDRERERDNRKRGVGTHRLAGRRGKRHLWR